MDTSDVQALVDDFGGNIDDLEEALAPLLQTALSASTSKLPLLDKAKLYVLATYAIESILFSALRLNGVDAKSHPVFQELTRVKEYFEKIKRAENAGAKRNTAVDKDAAGRFIKHGLAGNDKYDRERSHRAVAERAGAKRKLEDLRGVGTHTRFDGAAKRIEADEATTKRRELEPVVSQSSYTDKAGSKKRRKHESGVGAHMNSDADAAQNMKSPESAPRSHSDTSQALLQGPLPAVEEKKSRRKKRKTKGQMQQELEDQRSSEMK
ncbi:hypothetical protein LTR08_007683 [Meristemomyces frigidus]|nr:hypothetical protein LTR08_007683 [Meristemomyces frigidus]